MILNEIEKGLWKGESVYVYTRFGYSIIDLDQFQFETGRSKELEDPVIDSPIADIEASPISKDEPVDKEAENIENIDKEEKLKNEDKDKHEEQLSASKENEV